ncbi:hypothetical protein LQ318_00825 [Aliifodinibius salicampi]|uniref:Secreted protein n=1 Tax=Fodinibius salicampi TaxID=1920655 RepID=A0ABT3PU95_9BACT|nr:hypothetical protein [Fodinibius salicampi]MCW9711432.1 hypothetical protein [Fodinibius salicampi]
MFWAAYKKPKLARGMFFLLFGWASWFNYTTAHTTPEVYLDYASMSVDLCSESILGWFSHQYHSCHFSNTCWSWYYSSRYDIQGSVG